MPNIDIFMIDEFNRSIALVSFANDIYCCRCLAGTHNRIDCEPSVYRSGRGGKCIIFLYQVLTFSMRTWTGIHSCARTGEIAR